MNYTPKHLSKWTRSNSYFGAEWPEYYVFLSRHRDSDCLSRANFDAAKAALDSLSDYERKNNNNKNYSHHTIHEGHWAVGWVEWLAIHEKDTEALKAADQIMEKLESYPVVNEELFSQYEENEAEEVWKNCYSPKDRVAYIREHRSQFEFRDWRDLLGSVRGEYFGGYASELIA